MEMNAPNRSGTIGPFRFHPPLPEDASRRRRVLRAIYDFADSMLYWLWPWR